VLRCHVGRVHYESADRVWFGTLAWHCGLAASKYDTSNRRKPGRPPTVPSIARLVIRLAKENPLYVDPGIMWSLAADQVTSRSGVRQRFT